MSDFRPGLLVTEGISGMWHYHLSDPTRKYTALCGKQVMHTSILVESWGLRSGGLRHLESWCTECPRLARQQASREPTRVRFYWRQPGGGRRELTGTVTKVWHMGTRYRRYVVDVTEVRTLGGRRIKRDFRVWVEDVIGTL
jgi:hypothetical protein